ncbi:MAG: radical SAM protein [Holophagae bacterium]|jgi:radical SAM protein with 4Fe4S-binding SPASM domain
MINSEWIDRFNHTVVAERVPVSGMIELTRHCNLRCVHCYLGQGEGRFESHREMTTEQVCDVIDQIAEAGCLYLTLTGGDPMMRRDFAEVYRHAKNQGLLVTVMCDGVLVTSEIIELFQELPPLSVEVSVYGATASTYEAVTQVPGSFEHCIRGIRRLVEAGGFEVRLKTVLLSLNAHEAGAMRELAEGFGLRMKLDAAVFPCLHTGNTKPLDLRVPAQQVVQIELDDPQNVREWIQYLDRPSESPPSDGLYVCGAGVSAFYIDPYGFVYPCMMTTRYKYNLLESDFQTLWNDRLAELHETKARDGYECAGCELQRACASCPGLHDQEHGAEDIKSDYVCDTAKARWRALQDPSLRATVAEHEEGTA